MDQCRILKIIIWLYIWRKNSLFIGYTIKLLKSTRIYNFFSVGFQSVFKTSNKNNIHFQLCLVDKILSDKNDKIKFNFFSQEKSNIKRNYKILLLWRMHFMKLRVAQVFIKLHGFMVYQKVHWKTGHLG